MQNNQLTVPLKDFNYAMRVFKTDKPRKNAKKPLQITPAILSFSNGFLTIESNEKLVNIHAEGEWHGKAEFSNTIITALAAIPLNADPVIIKYADNKLYISSTYVSCTWTAFSSELISQLTKPSLIDIFAMRRTLPAHQFHGDGIEGQYKLAHTKMLKETEKQAKKLSEFEITQEDLLDIIEAKVELRIAKKIL